MNDFEKKQSYYSVVREDLRRLIPLHCKNILDVGCAFGKTWENMHDNYERITGIELDEQAAKNAKRVLDEVLVGDIEKLELPFPKEYFDCIFLADILEHLYDPWQTLKKLTALLKVGGVVVTSIPNIRHYKVIRGLLKGDWRYKSSGILDIGHIRFFTLSSMIEMIEKAGLRMTKITGIRKGSAKYRLLNALCFHHLDNFLVKQYYFVAEK